MSKLRPLIGQAVLVRAVPFLLPTDIVEAVFLLQMMADVAGMQ